jgi:hypothetical protein
MFNLLNKINMKKLLLLIGMMITFLCVFAQTEVPRYTLVEVFTSSTCPPCYGGNITLKNVLAQSDAEGGKYSLIKYQMSWPGTGDPYYTLEGNTRRGVYGVNAVPDVYMDGLKKATSLGNLRAAQAVTSNVEVSGHYTVVGQTVSATIKVRSTIDIAGSNNLRLYVGIVEKRTTMNVKTNGETEFLQVMKKMMPDASGIVLGDLTANQITTHELSWEFKGSYRLPANANSPINHDIEHSVENFGNLEVVAWVQSSSTRTIYNSCTACNGDQAVSVNYNVVGGNGTLTATAMGEEINSGAMVTAGVSAIFTAIPDANYKVKEWKLNGEIVPGNNTTNNYSTRCCENRTITVEFIELPKFDVNFSVVSGNGTLKAEVGGIEIDPGSEIYEQTLVEFTALPDEFYKVKEWKLNGVVVYGNTSNSYSVTIDKATTVTVEYKQAAFAINYEVVGNNGSLKAEVGDTEINSGDHVEDGKTVLFTATPDENYEVKEWKLDNAVVPDNISDNYSIVVSQAAAVVTVEFKEKVGITENNLSNVELYPNPVTNELTINNAEQIQKVTITNTLGQVIKEEILTGSPMVVISTQNLQPGIFLVTLKNNEGLEVTRKIVKK